MLKIHISGIICAGNTSFGWRNVKLFEEVFQRLVFKENCFTFTKATDRL
jgi:hypothetical protein